MNANRICDTIFTEIGKQILMEKLTLEYNRLLGTVPEELGLVKNLKEMTLYENNNLIWECANEIGTARRQRFFPERGSEQECRRH